MSGERNSLRALRIAAGVAAVCGLAMAATRLAALPEESGRWRKKAADLQEIRKLQATLEQQERVVAGFGAYPAAAPDLGPLLRNAFQGKTVATRERDAVPTLAGWTGRRVSVVIEDVEGADLDRFLENAAALRPPWGLAECVLQASGKSGRLSRAELTLVTVEKAAAP